MNELATEKTMTIKEVAEVLGISRSQVEKTVRELIPDKMKNGVTTFLNAAEVGEITTRLKGKPYLGNISEVTTDKEMSEMTLKVLQYHIEKSANLEAKNKTLTIENETMRPKAIIHDKIANAEGLKTMAQTAAVLNIGVNTLFSILRGDGIFYYDSNGINLPYREHIEADRFRVIEEPYKRGGVDHVYSKIMVTPKGEIWLANKFATN